MRSLDGGHCGIEPTTVVDLAVSPPVVAAAGQGTGSRPYNAADEFADPSPAPARVLSGMRPTGQLHLGNYHGALRNWVALQQHYECFFFVADWHALTTDYEDTSAAAAAYRSRWWSTGSPRASIRSARRSSCSPQVPAHAELHLLLSMITPLRWLERVPTYKDQQAQLKERTWPPTASSAIRCCRAPTS